MHRSNSTGNDDGVATDRTIVPWRGRGALAVSAVLLAAGVAWPDASDARKDPCTYGASGTADTTESQPVSYDVDQPGWGCTPLVSVSGTTGEEHLGAEADRDGVRLTDPPEGPEPPPPPPVPRRLELRVTPRNAEVGERTRFRFKATWVREEHRWAARRISIRFLNRTVTTNRRGRATIVAVLRRAGRPRAVAYRADRRLGVARVRAVG